MEKLVFIYKNESHRDGTLLLLVLAFLVYADVPVLEIVIQMHLARKRHYVAFRVEARGAGVSANNFVNDEFDFRNIDDDIGFFAFACETHLK
jgi:hypothetical protein